MAIIEFNPLQVHMTIIEFNPLQVHMTIIDVITCAGT